MKIEIIERSEKEVEKCDYRSAMQIKFDGKVVFEVGDGEPEDSNLSRDFNDVFLIPDMLKKVYEVGQSGEELYIIYSTSDDI